MDIFAAIYFAGLHLHGADVSRLAGAENRFQHQQRLKAKRDYSTCVSFSSSARLRSTPQR